MSDIQALIEDTFEKRDQLGADGIRQRAQAAVDEALGRLESGKARVAEPDGAGGWRVNQWLKKAVLLYFRMGQNHVVDGGPAMAFDKVPLRFGHGTKPSWKPWARAWCPERWCAAARTSATTRS